MILIKHTKVPARQLAKQLKDYQRGNESLKRELALTNTLVAAKDETTSLPRGRYNQPK